MEASDRHALPYDTSLTADEWRDIEDGAHEVIDALREKIDQRRLDRVVEQDRAGADSHALNLVCKADDALIELSEFADAVAEEVEHHDLDGDDDDG